MNTSLQQRLSETPQMSYPCSSRIHALKTFGESCYVKREDELGFGISGIKFRKYRTLLPYLLRQHCQEAVVIGGAFSNHVLSLVQLLIENGIKPKLFLKGPEPIEAKGNFLFLKMFVQNRSIHWIGKDEWQKIADIAQNYAETRVGAVVIPEGASIFEGFLGALTLPLDILRNEKEMGITFDHIFIDVGTGYTAAGLLLGLTVLEKKRNCHLIFMAGSEQEFRVNLNVLHSEFEKWLGANCSFPENFECLNCTIAPSFGSTNRALFDFIGQTAANEGFFLDPIYSAKLFYQTKQIIAEQKPKGNKLLIHSGGGLTLAGFQDQISKGRER